MGLLQLVRQDNDVQQGGVGGEQQGVLHATPKAWNSVLNRRGCVIRGDNKNYRQKYGKGTE